MYHAVQIFRFYSCEQIICRILFFKKRIIVDLIGYFSYFEWNFVQFGECSYLCRRINKNKDNNLNRNRL